MNSILAFLLTLQTANPQPVSLKQLLALLQIKPFDELAVQRKLTEISAANPEIEATFNHFKTNSYPDGFLSYEDSAKPRNAVLFRLNAFVVVSAQNYLGL